MMTAVPAMAADNYETGTVTAYRLFVRNGDSKEDKIIGGLRRGTDIQIVGTAESGWYEIIYEGELAYASNKYIAVDDEEAIARAHALAIVDAENEAAAKERASREVIEAITEESEDAEAETEETSEEAEAETEEASEEAEAESEEETSEEAEAETEETSEEAEAESEEETSEEAEAETEETSEEIEAESEEEASEETEAESKEESEEAEAESEEETSEEAEAETEETSEEAEAESEEEDDEDTSSGSYVIDASEDDVALLAALIYCEAGGESREGKVAVGAVVVNRVKSSSYPNTISGVVYQSGQFTPAATGKLARILSQGANSDCYEAAVASLNGENPIGDKLHFNGGRGQGIQIGNQHFY